MHEVAAFWARVFGAEIGPVYDSRNRPGFRSCWLMPADGPMVELMTGPWVKDFADGERAGYAHLALSVGSQMQVDNIASRLALEGSLVSDPRFTGDGFYQAVLRDPDGNLIEIMA